ncbi:MAG: taurine dioxygenase [Acidobacteria bacterium]|nr:MAG: taurine dioxygenase [Acidobacteriota bacterium]
MRATQAYPIPRRTLDTRAYRTIEVTPVTPTAGAEVRGVDLSRPLGEEQFAEIQDAFLRHLVLFFRGQRRLTPEEQIRFGHRFGPLHLHPAAPHAEGYPEVMIVRTDRDSKVHNGETWHSDVSCDAEPPLGSILQIHVLPPWGGDTLWANMYAAYDDLSASLKEILAGLVAVHESDHVYRGRYRDQGAEEDTGKVYPCSEHPVVRTHPETGKQAIFVNRIFTTRLKGLEPAESQALLQFLFRHVESPYYQVRFRWQQDDVALWDNRCTQHLAIWDYWPHERQGHRVAIKGDRPFYRG